MKKTTMIVSHRHSIFLTALSIGALSANCLSQELPTLRTIWTQPAEFPLDILFAGRVNAIAVHGSDDRIVLVGTESGGMFRSFDGAATFTHIDSYPTVLTAHQTLDVPLGQAGSYKGGSVNDVKFLGQTDIAIAAATPDPFTSMTNRSIWRSINTGVTWNSLPDPPPHPFTSLRAHAYCVGTGWDSQTVYVGSNRGLSKSVDRGLSWVQMDVFPRSASINPSIVAVKPIAPFGEVLAGGPSGLRRWSPTLAAWEDVSGFTGSIDSPHAIDAEGNLAFAINNALQIFVSQDTGRTWQQVPTSSLGSFGAAGGISCVRYRYFDSARNIIEIFYGNRYRLYKTKVERLNSTSPFIFASAVWDRLQIAHDDIRCLAFNGRNEPYLMGSDGGLHQALNSGTSWPFRAGARGGLTALQICDVIGQIRVNPGRYELYFSTQDNSLWPSPDGGITWPEDPSQTRPTGPEGYGLQCLRRSFGDDASPSSRITYAKAEGVSVFQSQPLFRVGTETAWRSAPGAVQSFPPTILGANLYVQPIGAGGVFRAGLALTLNGGVSWSQMGAFTNQPGFAAKGVAGVQTTVYQPVVLGTVPPASGFTFEKVGFVRSFRSSDGMVTRQYAAGSGLGSLGVFGTEFGFYQVYAVDPGNANHLIAADAVAGKMVRSINGGQSWDEIPGLTQLVTRNGTYRFNYNANGVARITLVSTISFCPDNPQFVLIGTQGSGIFTSSDRGYTWQYIEGSDKVRPVSHFYWKNWNDVIISTYGRGLWRMRGRAAVSWESRTASAIIPPPVADRVMPIAGGMEQPKTGHLIYYGRITGVEATAGRVRKIHIMPGSSHLFTGDTLNISDDVEIAETPQDLGFIGFEQQPKAPVEGWIPVGISFQAQSEITVTYAPAPMEYPGTHDTTLDQHHPDDPDPTADKPYVWPTHPPPADSTEPFIDTPQYVPGETVLIRAVRFDPSRPAGLTFSIDDQFFTPEVKWETNGAFQATFPAPHGFGPHQLLVRQKLETNEILVASTIFTRHKDEEHQGSLKIEAAFRLPDGTLRFTWQAEEGKIYRVDYTDDVSANAWTPSPQIPTVIGSSASFSEKIGSVFMRYYRVVEIFQLSNESFINRLH